MSGPAKVKEFPDISNKLNAPVKKSQFEKQKAEAEAKRKREEAENAAALREFVTSFDDDESGAHLDSHDRFGNAGYGQQVGVGGAGLGATPRRHFELEGSGPDSLAPAPPSLRKRALDEHRDSDDELLTESEFFRGFYPPDFNNPCKSIRSAHPECA
jgi:U2-associated protein SR140